MQSTSAPSVESVSDIIHGPVGNIEILVDSPRQSEPSIVAIVCHPHPLFGGNMSNKVTHILARACNDLDATAVRFNFRGVGRSEGAHDDGRGEVDDVLAVVEWVKQRWPNAMLWLAGFSFGAAMALRAALRRSDIARLVTVAPALRWLQQVSQASHCPWLVIQGDRDELVDVDAVRGWLQTLSEPPSLVVLSGAEHFFHGRLNDLREAVKAWLMR